MAKNAGAWPESGFRYLASFVLEHGLWFWALVLVWALAASGTRGSAEREERKKRRARRGKSEGGLLSVPALVVLATLGAHVGYYILVIGGDHFEYRVLSHIVPFIAISLAWALARSPFPTRRAVALFAGFWAVASVLPWIHWVESRDLTTREETYMMKVAVAPSLPPGLRWYGRGFDDLQFWLIDRYVAMRHQEHKVFARFQAEHFPDREEGARIGGDAFPVMRAQGTGVPAWTLPRVAIIDGGGLSDYVIARTPLRPGKRREMAHDRRPPPGYVESFRPNVDVSGGEVRVHEREVPLTADEIRALEARWRAWIDSQAR